MGKVLDIETVQSPWKRVQAELKVTSISRGALFKDAVNDAKRQNVEVCYVR